MQLFEALKKIREFKQPTGDVNPSASDAIPRFELLCGFTPLHLQTFFTARLIESLQSAVDVQIGLYGDLIGNISRTNGQAKGVAIVIEWADLDPRLGLRTTHGWRPDRANDVLESAHHRKSQLLASIRALTGKASVAVCLPTLPLPPMFLSSTNRLTSVSARLRSLVFEFAADLIDIGANVVEPQKFAESASNRANVSSELRSGFPYDTAHAASVAKLLVELLAPAPTLKGIITDLDNTLWSGIVGEDGVDAISWGLDQKTLHHGLYQEQLASLAQSGTLLAVASKNEESVVSQAFARDDMVVDTNQFFPIEANWGPKSESIARILQVWNINADAVMFIDDSPLEIAEVSAAYPEMLCRQFPTSDEQGVLDLLTEMRDRFGKTAVSEEDRIRTASIRASAELTTPTANPDSLLRDAEAQLHLSWDQPDARSLELINKTNQFNLNGIRLDESTWHQRNSAADTFLLGISYKDKYAPLGKIAVVQGTNSSNRVVISSWVMSCRAFSRRIEHGTMRAIFDRFKCDSIELQFEPTERNRPLQSWLVELTAGRVDATGSQPVTVTRDEFEQHSPNTFFEVVVHVDEHSKSA